MQSILFPLAVMLAVAKLGGEFCERFLKQPAVLAEILAGVLLGPSVLGWVDGRNQTLQQIAEIGSVLLLFEVGLECSLDELFQVGKEAIFVTVGGVILPLGLGFWFARLAGQLELSSIFVGAAMSATSVGITARVFSELNVLATKEARIVLAAAVADDVVGLILLAAVSGFAISGHFSPGSVARTTSIALVFLVAAIYIGLRSTPVLLKWARAMKTRAALSSAAVVFCFLLSSMAESVQLAPIVGSFASGIVLARTENKIHFEDKIKNIADIFIPVFFVLTGARADFHSVTLPILGLSFGLLIVAFVGKILAGLILPVKGIGRWIIGVGMVPRGEVGLIFAGVGLGRGIIGPGIYSAIILVVLATTFLTPPLLKLAIKRNSKGP